MSVLAGLLAGGVAAPIEAIGRTLDALFTSDDERAAAALVMERLRQQPGALQVELNKVEAAHRSVFVAGWRPFIGWVCGAGLAYTFLGHPLLEWAAALWARPELKPPVLMTDYLMELVVALLGLGTLRTVEKLGGKSR